MRSQQQSWAVWLVFQTCRTWILQICSLDWCIRRARELHSCISLKPSPISSWGSRNFRLGIPIAVLFLPPFHFINVFLILCFSSWEQFLRFDIWALGCSSPMMFDQALYPKDSDTKATFTTAFVFELIKWKEQIIYKQRYDSSCSVRPVYIILYGIIACNCCLGFP